MNIQIYPSIYPKNQHVHSQFPFYPNRNHRWPIPNPPRPRHLPVPSIHRRSFRSTAAAARALWLARCAVCAAWRRRWLWGGSSAFNGHGVGKRVMQPVEIGWRCGLVWSNDGHVSWTKANVSHFYTVLVTRTGGISPLWETSIVDP
jgi:hypothetical protein